MPTDDEDHKDDAHKSAANDEPEFEPADESVDDSDLSDAEQVRLWLAGADASAPAATALNQYLSAVWGHQQLDHEQEIRLAAQIQAEPRLARLRDGRPPHGHAPAPGELLTMLFDDLALAWGQLQAQASIYQHRPPDLDRLLREAQALGADGEADKPSYLTNWLNRGAWGTQGWEPVARLAFEVFVELYLFPSPVQNSLRAHLDRQQSGGETALLPTPAVFLSWLPADGEIQAEFDAISRHADEANLRLVRANLLRVVGVARRYVGHGVSLVDLIQAGNVGLLRAVENFEAARGGTFRTYAAGWMRQTITRTIGA